MKFKNFIVGDMFSIKSGVLRSEDIYRKISDTEFEGYSIHCENIKVSLDEMVYSVKFL